MLCRADRGDQGLELRLPDAVISRRIRLGRCMDSQIQFSRMKTFVVRECCSSVQNFTSGIPAEIVGNPTDTRPLTAVLSARMRSDTITQVAFQMSRAIDTNI